MGWVLMSEREVHRVEVLSSVVAGRMSSSEAASVLCVSNRQVQRLLKTFREDGAVALRHKARGRPSNNRSTEGLRDLTLAIVREHYADFGPTLAAEKLAERDGVKISRETLRKWIPESVSVPCNLHHSVPHAATISTLLANIRRFPRNEPERRSIEACEI